ncbi:MAG: VWA domain-containing protein [Firmicutes bacterium]|nr:VWA domain-containing protein [Candidatus Fermentithermobacillaceae bacterium]
MTYVEGSSLLERAALDKLISLLKRGLGARVAETAVVSTKVHLTDQAVPGEVQVVATSDAGRAFYHRRSSGQIVHADIFHSPGDVPPALVAMRVTKALTTLRLEAYGGCPVSPGSLVSFIDVQTALGGGRLDGLLLGGRELGARLAHKTHVHVTFLNCPELLASLFSMISAVESAIEGSGLELRKVRAVRMVRGDVPANLDDYRVTTDSLLREGMGPRAEAAGARAAETGNFFKSAPESAAWAVEPLRSPKGPPGGGNGPDALNSPGGPHGPARSDSACDSSDVLRRLDSTSGAITEALAREAVRLAGSYEDTVKLLRALAAGMKSGEFLRFKTQSMRDPEEIREAMLRSNLATYDGSSYFLSPEGEKVLQYLLSHRYEFEAYLRRLLRTLPSRCAVPGERARAPLRPTSSPRRAVAVSIEKGNWHGDLAVVETAISRGLRMDRRFRPEDLRFYFRREEKSRPVILLIDASASMAGKRLQSAKELARTLVLTGKDDVAICIFQDADVRLVSGFTRNPRQIEQALASIEASGLTPMARGLEGALAIAETKSRKPLVLLITDGIPTVPSSTLSPVDDAIDAARKLARRGVKLGCIGLEPNRGFLKQMVEAARGTLYIVDELESSVLASIARKERGY